MGWCSGTDIFDKMVAHILSRDHLSDAQKRETVKELIVVLEDHDWDCQSDSDYYWDQSLVREIFHELHPDWFEDEEEESE